MMPLKRMCVLLLILPVVARCLRIAPEEGPALTESKVDSVNIKHENHRGKRSEIINLDPRQNCNTWSPWVNRHHPIVNDVNDREHVSQQEMDAFCPPQHGGRVSNISCKDEKGEPFFGNRTGPRVEYFLSCYSPFVGVECVLSKQSYVPCPDMEMQYFCSCSNETSVTSSLDISTTTKHQYIALNHEMPPENTMYEYIEMRDRFEESGNIWQLPHTNILRCGRRCLADPFCVSVFFEETSSRCTAHNVVLGSGSPLSNVRYFVVK